VTTFVLRILFVRVIKFKEISVMWIANVLPDFVKRELVKSIQCCSLLGLGYLLVLFLRVLLSSFFARIVV